MCEDGQVLERALSHVTLDFGFRGRVYSATAGLCLEVPCLLYVGSCSVP
jgi:hypothetical protein